MRFIDIITDIENLAAQQISRPSLKRCVREVLNQYAASADWPHYRERGTIETVATYTTGTASVTAGSKTVTGASTVWTSGVTGMAGRKFRLNNEQVWYDIDTVESTTSLTLKQVYQGSTASAQGYTIFQDEYRLAGDVQKPLDFVQIQGGLVMLALNYLDVDQLYARTLSANDPILFTLIGKRDDRYTTGTVTIAVNGTTITGLGSPGWTSVPGLSKGNRIAITTSTEVYTIRSVDSDTQLTVYEPASAAATASAYTLYLNNARILFKEIPNNRRNIYYRYTRIPYPLVNDYDEPDMPREFHYMLVWGGLAMAFTMKGLLESAQWAEKKFTDWMQAQMLQMKESDPTTIYQKQSMDHLVTYPFRLRYPVDYGAAQFMLS